MLQQASRMLDFELGEKSQKKVVKNYFRKFGFIVLMMKK